MFPQYSSKIHKAHFLLHIACDLKLEDTLLHGFTVERCFDFRDYVARNTKVWVGKKGFGKRVIVGLLVASQDVWHLMLGMRTT
jgi:hypothetical protein